MRRLVTVLFLFALVGLCSARRAQADEVFAWTLPASPTIAPGNVDLGGFFGFTIPGVSFSENGVSQSGVFDFFNSNSGGGFDLGAAPVCAGTAIATCILDETGAQLYTGTESAPTFVPGTYFLTGFSDSLNSGGTGTLTIAAGANGDLFTYTFTPVPEPASLLLVGAGALSFLGFARKKILA
jgi:PEP-CTERM motif